jgi:hypothetical protein
MRDQVGQHQLHLVQCEETTGTGMFTVSKRHKRLVQGNARFWLGPLVRSFFAESEGVVRSRRGVVRLVVMNLLHWNHCLCAVRKHSPIRHLETVARRHLSQCEYCTRMLGPGRWTYTSGKCYDSEAGHAHRLANGGVCAV